MAVNIFRQTLVPTIGDVRQRNVTPRAADPLPDPATGDLWIDMSQTPPVLKVLDGALSGVVIATPPGTPTGTLQFNNAGAFGGITGSSVVTGAITLSPASGNIPLTLSPVGNTNTGLVISNMAGATIGLSIQRFSSTGDAIRILQVGGTQAVTFNVDNTAGPVLKLTMSGVDDKQALQLRRPNAAATTDLFQVYEPTDTNAMFLVNPSGPATGSVRIQSINVGMIISLSGAGAPLTCQINAGSALFDTGGANYIDLGGGSGPGAKVTNAPVGGSITITCPSNARTFDFLHSTGPRTGLRCTTANVFGTNDEIVSPLSDTTGWVILENFFGVTNQGVALSTSTTIPISIRPNRVETGRFPSGGGLILMQAAPTAGASQVSYGATTATTVGAAGGASALPATPTGYLIINVAGTQQKIPYYAN